ncbi:MAG: arsenate reductase (glutaredoxin) [Saprospiraceae bacterium]|nr:arsenate reductase (glutaredoxin) [Saprospiraceae bacterium]
MTSSTLIKIYHNNRCGKSRCALDVLKQSVKTFELVEYLKAPPTEAELTNLLALLNKRPLDIIRQKEPLFQEQFKGKSMSDAEWIRIIVENPILMERPIVVVGSRAWVARDEQSLAEISEQV